MVRVARDDGGLDINKLRSQQLKTIKIRYKYNQSLSKKFEHEVRN